MFFRGHHTTEITALNTSEFRKLRSYIYDLWTNCHTQKGWEALMHFVYNVHWMHWLSSIRKRSFTICHKVSLLWHFNWLTTNQILLRDSGQSQTIKLVVYLLWNATKLQSVSFLCVVYFLIDWSLKNLFHGISNMFISFLFGGLENSEWINWPKKVDAYSCTFFHVVVCLRYKTYIP